MHNISRMRIVCKKIYKHFIRNRSLTDIFLNAVKFCIQINVPFILYNIIISFIVVIVLRVENVLQYTGKENYIHFIHFILYRSKKKIHSGNKKP